MDRKQSFKNSSKIDLSKETNRQICIPKLLLSINDEKDIISHVSMLESCAILLSDNILLMKCFNDSNNSNNNKENETIIIDENQFIGSYAISYNSLEMIYTISLSGSLYCFSRNNKNDKFIINKLFDLPYHKCDKEIKPIMYLDAIKSLLVLICSNMIYFLTLDFNKLDQAEAVLGVVSFPLQQRNLYPYLENSLILPKDRIYNCNVWGSENKEMVVCAGNGTWLDIWPLKSVVEDGLSAWELEFPTFDAVRVVSDHTSWITALSKQIENSKISFYVTGDAEGEIQFWRCKKRNHNINNNDENLSSILLKIFKCSTMNVSPITAIMIDDNNIWVGDDTGAITFYQVDLRNEKIIKLKNIQTGSISGPTDFYWKYYDDRAEGRLKSFSSNGGTLYEYILHDSVVTVMKAWPDPSSVYWHKSQLEVCSLIDEWDLLVTAGSGNAVFLWDISTCKLLATIPTPDNFCTSLASFGERKLGNNVARIFIGHRNGHTQEYHIIIPSIDTDATVSSAQSNNEIDKFSLLSKLSNDAPEMIQMDILDVVQLEPSAQNSISDQNQPIIKKDIVVTDNLLTAILPPPVFNKSMELSTSIQQMYNSELACNTEYCPMPVTDILVSDLGYYVAYCYARRCLIIHDCRDNLALAQLQFDDSLIDISKITKSDNMYMENDSFVIVLLGKTTLKLLDAMNNSIVVSYDLNPLPYGDKLIYCVIWDSIISNNINLHKIQGIMLTHGLGIYSFDDLNGCHVLKPKNYSFNDEKISIDQLVCGSKAHNYNESPLTSIWMMRKLILLRLKLTDNTSQQQNNDENIQIVKSFEYNINDMKTRIIFSKSLKTTERTTMYRSIVVLSDGTVCVLRI